MQTFLCSLHISYRGYDDVDEDDDNIDYDVYDDVCAADGDDLVLMAEMLIMYYSTYPITMQFILSDYLHLAIFGCYLYYLPQNSVGVIAACFVHCENMKVGYQ